MRKTTSLFRKGLSIAHSNPAKEGSELSLSVGRAFDGLITISRRAVFFMVEAQ
jgi:hypothetical protein